MLDLDMMASFNCPYRCTIKVGREAHVVQAPKDVNTAERLVFCFFQHLQEALH